MHLRAVLLLGALPSLAACALSPYSGSEVVLWNEDVKYDGNFYILSAWDPQSSCIFVIPLPATDPHAAARAARAWEGSAFVSLGLRFDLWATGSRDTPDWSAAAPGGEGYSLAENLEWLGALDTLGESMPSLGGCFVGHLSGAEELFQTRPRDVYYATKPGDAAVYTDSANYTERQIRKGVELCVSESVRYRNDYDPARPLDRKHLTSVSPGAPDLRCSDK